MLRNASYLVLITIIAMGGSSIVSGQQPAPGTPVPKTPGAFDPSDVYFQGWLLSRDAEKLLEENKATEALEKLQKAQQLFDTISKSYPHWKPEMVAGRQQKTLASIAETKPLAKAEQDNKDLAVAEIEGGNRNIDDTPNNLNNPETILPNIDKPTAESLESKRIAELEKEIKRLQSGIEATNKLRETDRSSFERKRDEAVAELHRTQAELDRLRKEIAQRPVKNEMDALSRRINNIEAEKAVMGRALDASRKETTEAKAQVDALQKERSRLLSEVKDLQQNLADNQKQLKTERETSNEVVAGMQQQILKYQQQLKNKDGELTEANKRITKLELEINEVRTSFDELKEKYTDLLREHDQMAALLEKANDSVKIQEVINQTMAKDRELRELKNRYDALQTDNDATKDDLLEALRDLAISKLRIQEFRRENLDHQKRIKELNERLKNEVRELDTTTTDPTELAMLKAIIQRQLKVEEKRSQARDMLLTKLKEKAVKDPDIARAVKIYESYELNLTPEELEVIDGKKVDDVIISPYAKPRSEVEQSIAELERQTAPYEKAGDRAFESSRYYAAREIYELIVDLNPGDSTAICKLGLAEYKLGEFLDASETFQQATELDKENPYAHRMLGHILSKNLNDNNEGLKALTRAAELDPNEPITQILIGNVQFQIGNLEAAVEAFKSALLCDPTNADAHYNLAVIYAQLGRKSDGMEHYKESLKLNTAPNPELEKLLSKS